MARVTALRERRNLDARNAQARSDVALVDVELDGAPWRALPLDVVVRVRLTEGLELDRERLRELRRELRRAEALGTAVRALRYRDLTRARLEERLARRGVAAGAASEAVQTLEHAGYVDDARFAHLRARALADRDHGNEAIRWDLERQGVAEALANEAVAALAPESARAGAVARRRGRTAATARYLARKGFSAEVVEDLLTDVVAEEA